MGQVLTVMPFGNMVDMVRLYGRHLRMAFEHSVANYSPIDRPGAFFQMSGKTQSFKPARGVSYTGPVFLLIIDVLYQMQPP